MFSKCRKVLTTRLLRPLLQKRSFRISRSYLCQESISKNTGRALSTVTSRLSEQLKPNEGGTTCFQEAIVNNEQNCIEVTWDDEEEKSKYPILWLRDNCQCEVCFDRSALSRKMMIDDLNLQTKPITVTISDSQVEVNIDWSEGHKSIFSADWLKERSFTQKIQQNRAKLSRLEKVFWCSESFDSIPKIELRDILETDEGMLDWLQNLEIFGFLFITGAPPQHGVIKKLAERIAFIRRTHYGEEFSVTAKANPSNVALCSGPLQLHADLPYYQYKPGTQLLHCIEQFNGNGGDSLVADATNVAYQFKKEKRDTFDLLSGVLVDWCDVGQENGRHFHKVFQQPIIRLDSNGEIERINFSQPQRDSFFNASFDEVSQWYTAYKEFYDALTSPRYCTKFKMLPGAIQSFDNLRIVHGRTGYDGTRGNRYIEGCYIDWDEVRSKRRVLQRKLK